MSWNDHDHGGAMSSKSGRTMSLVLAKIERLEREGVSKLPPESELSAQLGVSRATLREALAQLENDGVVSRQRKVGTTIVRATDTAQTAPLDWFYPIDRIWSFPDFFESHDIPYDIEAVAVTTEASDQTVAHTLGLPEGAALYRIRRVFSVRGTRAILAEHRLAQHTNGRRTRIEALTAGISSFLRETEGIELSRVRSQVSAQLADRDLAAELETPVGTPLVSVDLELGALRDGVQATVAVGSLIVNPAIVQLGAVATRSVQP